MIFQDRMLKLLASVWNRLSWNLKKFQLIQYIQAIVICIFSCWLSDRFEILRGFTKFFFKQMLKVPGFYFEKQKRFISKKTYLKLLSISKQKKVYRPNLQWRFWYIDLFPSFYDNHWAIFELEKFTNCCYLCLAFSRSQA